MDGFSGDQFLIVTLIISAFFLINYLIDVMIFRYKSKLKKRTSEVMNMKEEKSELELLLDQMQADLEAKKEQEIEFFEKEQEEKSIISYSELKKAASKKVDYDNSNNVNESLASETIQEDNRVERLEEMLEQTKDLEKPNHDGTVLDNPIKNDDVNVVKNESSSFRNTDFISPVYGKQSSETNYSTIPTFTEDNDVIFEDEKEETPITVAPLNDPYDNSRYNSNDYDMAKDNNIVDNNLQVEESYDNNNTIDNINLESDGFDEPNPNNLSLEETLNLKPLSNEIKKNVEFLEALKELRSKL